MLVELGDLIKIYGLQDLSVIVTENRAEVTDRGRPIPSIFWLFYTFDQ